MFALAHELKVPFEVVEAMPLERFVEWSAFFKVKSDFESWAAKRREAGLPTVGFFHGQM